MLFLWRSGVPFVIIPPDPPPPEAVVVMTIAGVPIALQPGWSIKMTANGRDSFRGDVLSIPGSFRPAMDAEIIVTLDTLRLFGGEIQSPSERGLGNHPVQAITTTISAIDFNGFLDRRYITETIPAGTLRAALLQLETYFVTYGVTLDPAQADGPLLPELIFTRQKGVDVFTQLERLSGYIREIDHDKTLRMYAPGTLAAPFNISHNDGNVDGDITTEISRAAAGQTYANRVIVVAGTPEVPVVAQADDIAEQTARGLWEIAITDPTIFDETSAQALADAYLLQRTPTPKLARYATYRHGLKPGQTQTINIPWRNTNNAYIISDVDITTVGNRLRYMVTALEGSIYQPGWRNLYQQWLQPLTQVSLVPGGSSAGRTVHFLGGSENEYVQSTTPDWIPASAVQPILDTVQRGTTLAMVTIRLRARAGSVIARLRNVSDGITVGTSAEVTNTSWQTVIFAVTLTNGSKIYQLEVLPSIANTSVAAIGYLE